MSDEEVCNALLRSISYITPSVLEVFRSSKIIMTNPIKLETRTLRTLDEKSNQDLEYGQIQDCQYTLNFQF